MAQYSSQQNQDQNANTGGYVGELEASFGGFDTSSSSSATGGRISNGMIFNSSGGHIGIVKMLAIAGIAFIALKIWRRGK